MRIISSQNIELPTVSAEQMRRVDMLMVDMYHIELLQMMENAGRNLADLVETFSRSQAQPRQINIITILVGSGGNGGGGLVAARHLLNRGYTVRVVTAAQTTDFKPITSHQAVIINSMECAIEESIVIPACDLILDCLLGYSLDGDPIGQYAALINAANDCDTPIIALDTPSGLDVTTGETRNPCIKAVATMTLALPKTGFLSTTAQPYIGTLYLADIGVPPLLYRKYLNIDVPEDLFSAERVLQLTHAE